jgi:hypothetical protein
MNLKDMIAKMDAIDAPSKKQELKESASMNISMTADDAGQVGQLMNMMRNAGMSPEKVSDKPLTPRMDMEKHMKALGAMDDDPGIPGKDDVPGDMDLKAGAVGSGIGNIAGQAIGGGAVGGALGSLAGGGGLSGVAGGALGTMAGNAILPGVGGMVGGALGSAVGGAMNDDEQKEGDYANSPEEEYSPHTDVIKGGNDLNKSKKSYPKVAGGDNPMALASKIKEELSTLYKEYTGESIVKEGGVKSMMQDVEEGMGKAEFEKKYPGADYAEIKQDIKDNAEENN